MLEWVTKIISYFPLLPVVKERLALKDEEIKRLNDLNVRTSQNLALLAESRNQPHQAKTFIQPEIVSAAVRNALSTGQFSTLKVLSYTTETLDNFIPYDLRNADFFIQLLVRDPKVERKDETLFNSKFGSRVPRPWKKADSIEDLIKRPWPYRSRRVIRFYSEPPSLKLFLLVGAQKSQAFFGFYRWQEIPLTGGSQFKGSNASMLHLSSEIETEAAVLENINSKFDSMWLTAKSS